MLSKDNFMETLRSKLHFDKKDLFNFICTELPMVNKDYNWVGIYVLRGEKLVLDAFHGEKTEHEVIALGEGLCSQAIVTNAIVNESDVKGNSKYLACFPSTKSEIVVPINSDGVPVGELDIDSDRESAFTDDDESFLADVASIISPMVKEASDKS